MPAGQFARVRKGPTPSASVDHPTIHGTTRRQCAPLRAVRPAPRCHLRLRYAGGDPLGLHACRPGRRWWRHDRCARGEGQSQCSPWGMPARSNRPRQSPGSRRDGGERSPRPAFRPSHRNFDEEALLLRERGCSYSAVARSLGTREMARLCALGNHVRHRENLSKEAVERR